MNRHWQNLGTLFLVKIGYSTDMGAIPVQDTPVKLAIVVKVIGRTGSRGQVSIAVHSSIDQSTQKVLALVEVLSGSGAFKYGLQFTN